MSLRKSTDLSKGLVKRCTKVILDKKWGCDVEGEKVSKGDNEKRTNVEGQKKTHWNWDRRMKGRSSVMGKEEKEKHRDK